MSTLQKNIIYNALGQGAVLIVGFVALRFIYRKLGADELGVIYFTLTLNSVLCAALEMGISSTVIREIATRHQREPDYVEALVQTSSFIYWATFLALALLLNWSAPILVDHWINLRTMEAGAAVATIRILGTAALLGLPRSLLVSLFRGFERMGLNNAIDLTISGLQQFGIAIILYFGGGLFSVVYWLAATFILWVCLYLFAAGLVLPRRALLPSFSWEPLKRSGSFSARMAGISVLSLVHLQGDKMIVSKLLPVADLGFYGFASQLVVRASALTTAVSMAAYPSLSASLETQGHAAAAAQYHKLHDLICIGTVPVFAAIVFATVPVFSHIFSPTVAHQLQLPVLLLCIGQYMNGSMNMPYYFSLAAGRPDIAVRWASVALLVSSLPTIWLTYHFGLSGAASGWVLYHILTYVYGLPTICRECLRIRVAAWYWHMSKISLLALVSYGSTWLIMDTSLVINVEVAFLAFVIASLVYLTGAFFLMNRDLKIQLSRPISGLLLRGSALLK